jgi:hypothetical protein
MPKIDRWENFPKGVRQHLVERMRDRAISIADLNKLRLWIETQPEVPADDWYQDFGSFKLCGRGPLAKTFLPRSGRKGYGAAIDPLRRLSRLYP